MSQIYKDRSTGPVPPTVPTSFTTDVRDNTTAGPGTAIPAANVLQILGRQTVQNNDNGQRTDADPNNGNVVKVELTNRQTGTVTTADATVTTIITFDLGATPGTYYIYGNVQAFNSSGPASAAYSFSGGYRTNGSIATELGTEFHDTFQDLALITTDVLLTVNGLDNNVYVQVQGVAATSINWNALLEYRRVF